MNLKNLYNILKNIREVMMSTLTTKHFILYQPSLNDLSAIQDFEDRNRHHLNKWQSLDDQIHERLKNWIKECEEGKSVRFIVKPKDEHLKIIGFCNFTQIFYGAFQACYLGYKIDHEYEGKGLMTEALQASINYVFEQLNIHRIMANYIPRNTRSEKLLQKLGFTIEGYAKNYLLIDGKWEDHILTALSFEQWQKTLKKTPLPSDQKTDDINLIYRKVQISDTPFLLELMDQLGYPIDIAIMKENIQKYLESPNHQAFVAEYSGKIVGCIAMAITQYFHKPASFLRVIALVVDQRYRRMGIGKDLLDRAENVALQNGCSQIELTSAVHRAELGSHDFYRSRGYLELNNIKKYLAKKLCS